MNSLIMNTLRIKYVRIIYKYIRIILYMHNLIWKTALA